MEKQLFWAFKKKKSKECEEMSNNIFEERKEFDKEEFLKKIHEEEGEHGNSVDGGTEKSNPDKEL